MAFNLLNADMWQSVEKVPFLRRLVCYDSMANDSECSATDYYDRVHEVASTLSDTPQSQMALLLSGVTLLNLYVQANWTGPMPSIPSTLAIITKQKETRTLLEMDGEPFYSRASFSFFLQLARICLIDNYSFLDTCRSSCWWSCRTMMYHQRSLPNPTPTLKSSINERFQIVSRFYVDVDYDGDTPEETNRNMDLAAAAKLEQALCFHHFRQLNKVNEAVKEAAKISGLATELTGVMGRRTRFQTFDTAQMVLLVTTHRSPSTMVVDEVPLEFNDDHKFVREVTNDDPTMLSRPKLAEGNVHDTRALRIVDQAIILAQCLNVKNQNPNNGLTTEEMMPYVHKVLERSNSWIVHSQGLLMKSRLEATSSKTADRAALQVQALVEQLEGDNTSFAADRLRFVYTTDYPSRWELEREVGERFLSVGAAATAFDLFERLEMWADAIKCLAVMGRHARAEDLVLARIEIEPSPELWCVLGDLKDDTAHYVTAWELSRKRYSRAQRSIGHYNIKRGLWAEAIEAFQMALAINPLFPGSWFSLGCAGMRLERWEVALNAFSRVVSLEPDEAEAYGNLAAIYMMQGKLDRAFSALQEGIRYRRDNWKMWENYLQVCMGLKDYQNAVQAVLSIFELAERKVDLRVLEVIASFVTDDSLDRTGINGRRVEKKVSEMFGKITSSLTNNPDVWGIYSRYHARLGNTDKAVDLQQRACRAMEASNWEAADNIGPFDRVVKFASTLIDLYRSQTPIIMGNIHSAKLKLTSLIKKSQVAYSESDSFKLLNKLLAELNEPIVPVVVAVPAAADPMVTSEQPTSQ
eukprot:gene3999-4630_t